MGLKFRIFTKAEHYTMSSAAALLRKAAAASAAPKAAHPASPAAAHVAAPKAAHSAASSAPPKAAKLCTEFRKSMPCYRKHCWDADCRKAKALAPAALPKHSAPAKADGGVFAQLAAMQKKLDQIEDKIDSGFEAQEKRSLALQEKGSRAYADTMEMFRNFGNMMTGGFTAINTAHRELPALLARPAICASAPVRSSVTEVGELPFSRGGGSSASEAPGSGMTGTHKDDMTVLCSTYGFPHQGHVYNVLCALFGTNPVSDHHVSMLSTISEHVKDDVLAALLFLLLTGSQQFTKASFTIFRTECDTFIAKHRDYIFEIFSRVCEDFIKKCPKWQIKKKDLKTRDDIVKASNLQLREKTQHRAVFDNLVRNFSS